MTDVAHAVRAVARGVVRTPPSEINRNPRTKLARQIPPVDESQLQSAARFVPEVPVPEQSQRAIGCGESVSEWLDGWRGGVHVA